MNTIKNTIYLAVVTFVAAGFVPQSFAQDANANKSHEHKTQMSESHSLKYLQHTENKYICMVNNKRFDKVQIPTEVDGKTYYGCCSMCKAKLEKSQDLREAIDPVSGNIVDKATAFIGTDPDGMAYYFESEENMKKFDDEKSLTITKPY